MKLVTVEEMLEIEKQADASGHSYGAMMELAGTNLAKWIKIYYEDELALGILGLVGKGNNGGDTLVALAALAMEGVYANAYLTTSRPDDDPLVRRLIEEGGEIYQIDDDPELVQLKHLLSDHAILLDGIFGTGIKLPLRGQAAAVLSTMRDWMAEEGDRIVIAVDCPSGLDCRTGQAAPETIPADVTITMAAGKTGLYAHEAIRLTGSIYTVPIGLADDLPAWRAIRRFVIGAQDVQALLPVRPPDAHKGTFGTALIVAGSENYTGAALLAGKAAFRAGTGLVTLGVPRSLHPALAGHFPEATWLLLPEEVGAIAGPAAEIVLRNLARVTGMLIGPGFGLEDGTAAFIRNLLESGVEIPPLVVDADGLKLLTGVPDWEQKIPPGTVLTPHPGEMAVLTGLPVSEIQQDRLQVAEHYAREWGHVVVLKGAYTIIASPDGRSALIPYATAALARAGTGDVLAGIITGLRAQGMLGYEAALAGAWLHAYSGILAADQAGSTAAVLAGDVLAALPHVLALME